MKIKVSKIKLTLKYLKLYIYKYILPGVAYLAWWDPQLHQNSVNQTWPSPQPRYTKQRSSRFRSCQLGKLLLRNSLKSIFWLTKNTQLKYLTKYLSRLSLESGNYQILYITSPTYFYGGLHIYIYIYHHPKAKKVRSYYLTNNLLNKIFPSQD